MVKRTFRKKAQMKIQQTAFMLMAITLFFVMVGIFLVGFKISGIKSSAENLREQNTLLLVSKIANSPEFSCGVDFEGNSNCMDSDKLMALKKNIGKYEGFWDVSGIEIRKIDGEEKEVICELSNYPDCNKIILFADNKGIYTGSFVSLCRKAGSSGYFYNKCELAKVMVAYNVK